MSLKLIVNFQYEYLFVISIRKFYSFHSRERRQPVTRSGVLLFMKEEHKMPDYLCVMIVGSLVIGFILGRWRVLPDYCGDVIISADSETCTFALDIPADDIPQYHELVFRVVKEKDNR